MGQSVEQFERAGLPVGQWQIVKTRGRRRPLRWDGEETLAVYITSASDIDDFIPIVTAYQIEWNKIHGRLARTGNTKVGPDLIVARLGMDADAVETLRKALGTMWQQVLSDMEDRTCDMAIRLLDGSFREYQRSSQRWWNAIEVVAREKHRGVTRPVYFVSSNSHSIANLMGGYAVRHRDEILAFTQRVNLEGLGPHLERAMAKQDEATTLSILYYALRAFLHEPGESEKRMADVQASDAAVGIRTISSPGKIDVDAQIVELGRLVPENLDPRLTMDGMELLTKSNAIIINIDYPLGMAAYHHLSALAAGIDDIRGVYVMGKAATLNGRVGDVMISKVVHDVHSGNTYLFRNALAAHDVQPYMKHGTVLDNQKALTVRSAFLQNRDFMDSYYRDGFTVMEMEAGPYLSSVYETTAPQRHPRDEIVNLAENVDFELGVIHYASDTPYSRRQELLSKSLSFFGVESTYGCAIAIARRIIKREIERLRIAG